MKNNIVELQKKCARIIANLENTPFMAIPIDIIMKVRCLTYNELINIINMN